MSYKYEDHTADVAVVVENASLQELFKEAAIATMELNAKLDNIKPKESFHIEKHNKDMRALLYEFLEEIIFLKDSEDVILSEFELDIDDDGNLVCEAAGEKIDHKRMKMGVDVKAMTYHKFTLEYDDETWKTHFILDI